MNQNNISFEHIQWIMSSLSPIFVALMGLIWFLLREMIKAKDALAEANKEVMPLAEKLIDLNDILNAIIQSSNFNKKD